MKTMCSRNNNFSNRGQKFKLYVYQKAVIVPNVPTNSNSDFQTSNINGDKTPVVGIVVSVLVVVGLIGVIVFKRNDIISKYASKTKKNIKLNTSSRI